MVNVWAAICCSLQMSAKCQICQPRNGGDVNLKMQIHSVYIIHHMNWSSLTWPKHNTTSTDNLAFLAGVLSIKVVSLSLGEMHLESNLEICRIWNQCCRATIAIGHLLSYFIFPWSLFQLRASAFTPILPSHTLHHPMSFHRMSYCWKKSCNTWDGILNSYKLEIFKDDYLCMQRFFISTDTACLPSTISSSSFSLAPQVDPDPHSMQPVAFDYHLNSIHWIFVKTDPGRVF